MAKSRHRKGHKEKVAARKKRIEDNKSKMAKLQKKFLMDLINREKEKGLFENNELMNSLSGNVPILSSDPIINELKDDVATDGPSI